MDAETQTDSMDISEPDLSPTASCPPTSYPPTSGPASNCSTSTAYPQRVILEEFKNGLDAEGSNGNCVQLHYMVPHPEPGNNVFTKKKNN